METVAVIAVIFLGNCCGDCSHFPWKLLWLLQSFSSVFPWKLLRSWQSFSSETAAVIAVKLDHDHA
jgi:hypothetical protein